MIWRSRGPGSHLLATGAFVILLACSDRGGAAGGRGGDIPGSFGARAGAEAGVGTEGAEGGGSGSQVGPDADSRASGFASAPVQAVDDEGRTVRLERPARRIISLLPATTETLVALGAADRLVARTEYDDSSLVRLPSVGGGLTPSLEIMASLRPDLVIAWEEGGGARVRPRLEALGISVFAVATRDTADIYANVERLGHLTGLDESAATLAARMRSELDRVRASVANRPHPRVLYVIGVDPPIVAGPKVFIGEVLEVAGGNNVFSEVTAPSPQMSLEEIVRRRPEVVLLPNSGTGSTTLARLRGMPGWSALIDSDATRFHLLPADILHRPGPSIVEAAWILRDAIYPDLAGRR